jgi:hypothetical protein
MRGPGVVGAYLIVDGVVVGRQSKADGGVSWGCGAAVVVEGESGIRRWLGGAQRSCRLYGSGLNVSQLACTRLACFQPAGGGEGFLQGGTYAPSC